MAELSKQVVVTGVSTGIGWGISQHLIKNGFNVLGSVRKAEDATRLKNEFGNAFTPLIFDVRNPDEIYKAANQVRDILKGQKLFGLVNNAGLALGGPLLHQSPDEFRMQLEVNVIGALHVTQSFAPLLGADTALTGKPGRIVNISSVGGKMGAPFLGGYVASKHALEGMSEVLRRELLLYGIDVIVVAPGSVITPIWDKAEKRSTSDFDDTPYGPSGRKFFQYFLNEGRNGLHAETLGKVVHHALTTPFPKTRYAVVKQKLVKWTIPMLLPKRWVDRIIGKQLGLLD